MNGTWHPVYLGLGSNIGDARAHIKRSIKAIASQTNIALVDVASLYATTAWGKTDQADFVNTVVQISTILSPQQLLRAMQTIENDMGRVRIDKWGPRIIDIDILLYDKFVVNQQQLVIPHPYITQRDFVLVPLFELNPRLIIPEHGKLEKFMPKNLDGDHIIAIEKL